MTPFVIFSLPRSRSTWLSVLLSHNGRAVGHDVGSESKTPEDFVARVRQAGGTCETGASFAWRKIRELMPEAQFIVVSRPVGDVIHSLESLGMVGLVDEMLKRDAELREIQSNVPHLSIRYDQLDEFWACDLIHKAALGEPLDPAWFEKMVHTNVQVDLRWQMERLRINRLDIEALKRAANG